MAPLPGLNQRRIFWFFLRARESLDHRPAIAARQEARMSRQELTNLRRAAMVSTAPVVGLLSACAYALAPVTSSIYGKVRGPIAATSQATPATKTGRACSNSILGIVATGDASIDAAKRAGDITSVASVDFESTNVLFLYASFCTVVRGT